MPVLEKAKLAVIRPSSSRSNPQVEAGSEQEVQFNPATLKLTLKNVQDQGENRGRQVRQYVGSDSESYSLELHFDSADQARGPQPVSVREKTWIVERYLRPRARGVQPPRLRFTWGDFVIDGVVDSLDLEFDHFAHTGVPLRAKATLTLKKQDSSLEVLPEEARQAGQTQSRPGESGSGTPGRGGGSPDSADEVTSAQAGESPAEAASRLGLDPSAWRGLSLDLEAGLAAGVGLSLSAGAEIGLSASVGVSAGLGVHVGFEAGVSASVEASFGLSASASVAAGATVAFGASASASLGAGFKLTAAGGVEAALELSAGFEASVAVAGTVAAFGLAGTGVGTADFGVSSSFGVSASSTSFSLAATGTPSSGGPVASASAAAALPSAATRPAQPRTPLSRATARAGAHRQPAPAPPPPRTDPRATSYGRGLPLRARIETRTARPSERVDSRSPAVATSPRTAPWEALPVGDRGRQIADLQQTERRTSSSCACTCAPGSTRAPWSIERDEEVES